MSEKFNGFSQDEINKVSGSRTKINIKKHVTADAMSLRSQQQPIGIRRMPDKQSKQPQQQQQAEQFRKQQQVGINGSGGGSSRATTTTTSEATRQQQQSRSSNNNQNGNDPNTDDTLNLDETMSKSLENALFFAPLKMQTNATNNPKPDLSNNTESESTDDSSILKLSTLHQNSSDDASILANSNTNSAAHLNTDSPFKGVSLKDFETHRRMIEEQNKQKKALLYQAIEQHTQKTAAETRKIAEIRHELSKLESDLAVDVALLRKQIDAACIHFTNVEKQYIKIEAQFLKSKIELHNAAEKKELLTEHLCTVIAHNEDRKAQKLSELMQKVGLTTNDDYVAPTTTTSAEN